MSASVVADRLQLRVIYVNDGSRDSSGQVLEELARDDKQVKVLHFVRNYGQTAAPTAYLASIAPCWSLWTLICRTTPATSPTGCRT